jgi:hypothetical protein
MTQYDIDLANFLDREELMEALGDEDEPMTRCSECGHAISDDSIYSTCDDCEVH